MKKSVAASNREDRDDQDSAVVGYMCLVDFQWELGAAIGGNVVYPSIEDCQAQRKCVAECGIVEVEVRFRKVVQQPNDDH